MAMAASYRQGRDYMRSQIETASQTQLILLLYDGAIRFLSLGLHAMEASDQAVSGSGQRLTPEGRIKLIEQKNTYLVKGQRIISELISTLDHAQGGDVAANLHRLYTYMLPRVVEGNLNDQSDPIREVIGLLRELRASWEEVDRQSRVTVEGSRIKDEGR